MKNTIAMLLCFVLTCLCVCALGEARTAPADRSTTICEDINATAIYKKYEQTFYDEPSTQPGTVVRIDYTTDAYGDPIDTWANVYLPYGYDESGATKYNIIYFMHGTNENQDSFIGEARCKNAIDNMIEMGISDPVIMVFPTYYYDYEARATEHTTFIDEVRSDLMPAVESVYHTYAETADEAGFIASRAHRAICGYSQGGSVTWTLLGGTLDYVKWFLPFSGSSARNYDPLKAAMNAYPDYAKDMFIFMACGNKRDIAYDGVVELTNKMLKDSDFSFGMDTTANNFYTITGQEIHQTMMSRFYLYNAFDVLFR